MLLIDHMGLKMQSELVSFNHLFAKRYAFARDVNRCSGFDIFSS